MYVCLVGFGALSEPVLMFALLALDSDSPVVEFMYLVHSYVRQELP